MSIYCCGCRCGSTESLIRSFLERVGYADWLSIPIEEGKERSMKLIERFPPTPELEMLIDYLRDRGKWAVIIGWDNGTCRWTDITSSPKSVILAEVLVQQFA